MNANTTTTNNSVSAASDASAASGYYQRHIFFCTNERENGEACCADHRAADAAAHCKKMVKAANLNGAGKVRVNKAGCLDRCAAGPVCVVYPDAVWYSYVDERDIEEIVDSHLKNGQVVQRLVVPPHVGK